MKKYIGTKEVQAEPMTYGEAYKNGLIPESAHVSEYDENPGYLIQYADGYKSWSPAKVFEDSYKVAESVLDRVNIECYEIKKHTDKLGVFIFNQNDGKDFQVLPLGTRAMLMAQFHAMDAYLNLLNLRRSCIEDGVEYNPWGLTFEQILPLIREGYAVRRDAWGEDGRMVFKQVPSHITSDIIPKMQSLPEEAKRQVLKAGDHIDYVAQCLIFNPQNGEGNSWTPSIEDVFANDWQIVL